MKNVKIILSIFVFSLFFTGVGLSQGLGFKAGLNMANLSVDDDEFESDAKLGFQLGAFYEVAAGDALVIRPGLSYSTKGAKDPEEEGEISLGYIDIPVDVIYKLDVGTNKLGIHAGPYLGLLMSADADGDDIKDFLKGTDFGINVGVGFELTNILIDLNYGLGLSSIDDSGDDDAPSVKNTNISFTVGYRL